MNYIWNNDTLSLYDGDTLVAEIGFSTIADGTHTLLNEHGLAMLTEVKELQVKLPLHLLQESKKKVKNYYHFAHTLINLCKSILSMQIY